MLSFDALYRYKKQKVEHKAYMGPINKKCPKYNVVAIRVFITITSISSFDYLLQCKWLTIIILRLTNNIDNLM